ncbi:MAG TPA: hypothetical protein VFA09_21315 [Ktedonobacteraceae bacterium]|nr:hypothetical protein [Ktedonobacteraceae bacterium]
MTSPFAITAASNTVLLDNNRQAQTSFTVSNTTSHTIRGRAHLVVQPSSAEPWLRMQGEAEREFAASESEQYVVQLIVPPGVPAGDYTFRLDVVDLANPDDNFSEGPTVKFVVPAPVPAKRPFPWWIVAVAVGILILIGAGTYGLVQLSHKNPTVASTATVTKPTPTPLPPTPTPTPKPLFSPGTWQGQFDNGPIQFSLIVNTIQNGAIAGTLDQSHFEGATVENITGTEGNLNLFAPNAQNRLQFAIQHFGNGTGIFVDFTNLSFAPGSKGIANLCIAVLNCSFDAVVYQDGSLHGVYFYPGHTQPDGTFVLDKISQGSIPTEYPPNLLNAPLPSGSRDSYVKDSAVL